MSTFSFTVEEEVKQTNCDNAMLLSVLGVSAMAGDVSQTLRQEEGKLLIVNCDYDQDDGHDDDQDDDHGDGGGDGRQCWSDFEAGSVVSVPT